MSLLIYPNGSNKSVKNLGWLLRNWQIVNSFEFKYTPEESNDGVLIAHCQGVTYQTEYASASVMWHWLNRPVFRTRVLAISDARYTIGDEQWKKIDALPHAFFYHTVFNKPIEWETQCCKVRPVTGYPRSLTAIGICPKCHGYNVNCNIKGMTQTESLKFWDYIAGK